MRDVPRPSEVAYNNLGPGCAKRLGTIIFTSNESPDGQISLTKDLNDLSTHSADAPRSARDENWCVDRHDASLLFERM